MRSKLWVLAMAVLVGLVAGGMAEAATEKLLDTTLFESNEETFRWSEGSTINLDGKDHLLMSVTLFGGGGHDNSTAQILAFHSLDGGLTWTPYDQATVLQENVGEENTMSPSLLKLDNGDVLCFANVKNSFEDSGPWVKRSTDGAATWGELSRLPFEGYGALGSDRAIQISTGRVLVPAWFSMDKLGSSHTCVMYSDDRGATWARSPIVSTPKGSTGRKTDPAAEEPMIIELKDGRLMMIMRTYLKSIYASYSSDGGATWTAPASSGIPSPGSMATVKRLPNGDILLVWNWAPLDKIGGPWPRNHISTAISKDDGKNFSSVRHLDGADDFEGKITMANVVFSDDDKVVITYSKSMTKKNAYAWRLQVIPLAWFYEGDMTQVYGESYLPTVEAGAAGGPGTRSMPAETRQKILTEQLGTQSAEDGKEPDLVAAYHFEGGDPDFAIETSVNANDLTINPGAGSPTWADSKFGKSVAFDGKTGLLVAADSESLRIPSGQFTVEAWVYPTAEKEYAVICSKEHQFELGINDGRLQAAVRCGGTWGPGWVGDAAVPLREWSHVACTFDRERIRLYLNEKRVTSVPRKCAMDVTDELFVVGGCSNINDSTFAGHIDELKVWQSIRFDPSAVGAGNQEQAPRAVGATHQLFIDDDLIAMNNGLERVVNQPAKHHLNPVLTYEKPWEGNCVLTWGSVLYDETEQCFKVWYMVYKKFTPNNDPMLICYATSLDGLHWNKPDLGLVDYMGSKANNIVLWLKEGYIDAPTVLKVPSPTPDCVYRMYYHHGNSHGIRTATSPDGIQWTLGDKVVVASGDRSTVRYDPVTKKYRLLTRIPGRGERTIGLWESTDGEHFEAKGELLAADDGDPEDTQLYGMIEFKCGDLYLGFLEPFFIPTRKLNTQLAYSRDGLAWRRTCGRQTFLDYGAAGAWDQAWVTPSHNPPIRVGDKLYVFYQGRQTLHWAQEPYGHIGGVGLAIMRPDGFVSLDSQWEEGAVTTAPLLLEGKALHVNAFARPGYVCAALSDMAGNPLPGFTREECVPLEMVDALDHTLTWTGGKDLAALKGIPVQLSFYVQGAKLYSFWVE